MTFLTRFDLANFAGQLRLPDGTTPKTLRKGTLVIFGRDDDSDREALLGDFMAKDFPWRGTLVPVDSPEADRVRFERDWEDKRDARVAEILKGLGKRNIAEVRGTLTGGFHYDPASLSPELLELQRWLVAQPPAPPKPGLLASLFAKPQPPKKAWNF